MAYTSPSYLLLPHIFFAKNDSGLGVKGRFRQGGKLLFSHDHNLHVELTAQINEPHAVVLAFFSDVDNCPIKIRMMVGVANDLTTKIGVTGYSIDPNVAGVSWFSLMKSGLRRRGHCYH
jgi:hypothetical protein